MTSIRVNLGERSYDLVVTGKDHDDFGTFAQQRLRGRKALVVTDRNVEQHANQSAADLKQAGFETAVVVRPAGEGQKSLAVAAELYDRLVDFQADRQTAVVAVGGGVIGDL